MAQLEGTALVEVRTICSTMEETATYAENAMLTKADEELDQGAVTRLASQFGNFLDRLTAIQAVPEHTFSALPAEPSWGEVFIAYGQAADYLKALAEAQAPAKS
jgi:hypothetical protein